MRFSVVCVFLHDFLWDCSMVFFAVGTSCRLVECHTFPDKCPRWFRTGFPLLFFASPLFWVAVSAQCAYIAFPVWSVSLIYAPYVLELRSRTRNSVTSRGSKGISVSTCLGLSDVHVMWQDKWNQTSLDEINSVKPLQASETNTNLWNRLKCVSTENPTIRLKPTKAEWKILSQWSDEKQMKTISCVISDLLSTDLLPSLLCCFMFRSNGIRRKAKYAPRDSLATTLHHEVGFGRNGGKLLHVGSCTYVCKFWSKF